MLKSLLTVVCASLIVGVSQAQIAARQDKWIGSILKGKPGSEKPVPDDFHTFFDQAAAENAGKWGFVEPVRDSMDFSTLDVMYAYAKERGMRFTIHSITRLERQPPWLEALPPEEIREEFEEWIAALAERYPDAYSVDVVNEAAHGKLGTDPVKAALGGEGASGWDDVVWVYRKAKEYFPNSILLLSDYDVLKSDSVSSFPEVYRDYNELTEVLVDSNVLDALGPQGHWLGGRRFDYEWVTRRLDELDSVSGGLPIHITEYDLNSDSDDYQLEKYQTSLRAMLDYPTVEGVTLWGYREDQHWLDNAYVVAEDGSERPAMTWLREYMAPDPIDGNRLEAENWDAMFGMFYNGDSTAVEASPETLTTAEGGDSTFVRWRVVDVDGDDALALRYRASGDGHEVSLALDSVGASPVWSQTLADTEGEFRNDTFELASSLEGVRDVNFVYRAADGGTSTDFALDYLSLGSFEASADTTTADTTTSGILADVLPASALEVFPNPADGQVNVRLDVAAIVELRSVTGQRVYGPLVAEPGQTLAVPTERLARGAYVVRAIAGDRVGVRQVMVR